MKVLILIVLLSFLFKLFQFTKGYYNSNVTPNSTVNVSDSETVFKGVTNFHLLILNILTRFLVVTIGLVCNILTFLVLNRKQMRHQSTYYYLRVLAIADFVVTSF